MKNHLEKVHRVKEEWQTFIVREEGSENGQRQQTKITSSSLPPERPSSTRVLQEKSPNNQEDPLEAASWCEPLERWGHTVTSPLQHQMSESEVDLDDPPELTLDVPPTPEPYIPTQKGITEKVTYHPTPVPTTCSPPKAPASPELTDFNIQTRRRPMSRSPLVLKRLPEKDREDTYDRLHLDPRVAFAGAPSSYYQGWPGTLMRRLRTEARNSTQRHQKYLMPNDYVLKKEETAILPDGTLYRLTSTWVRDPSSKESKNVETQYEN